MGLYKTSYLVKLEEAALTPSRASVDQVLDHDWHYEQARKLHTASFLKDSGAFFTNDELSSLVANKVKSQLTDNYVVFDPACGSGDLLLACAELMKPSSTLFDTLKIWGTKLAGVDINESFVRAAKARLLLLARKLTNDYSDIDFSLANIFEKIVVGDGLSVDLPAAERLVIVMNPPFNPMLSQRGCKWADGSITSAATFVHRFVMDSCVGTRIISILPEVLRSGSRYEKWRNIVSHNCIDMERDAHGRFSAFANVDVFVLSVTVQRDDIKKPFAWWDSKPIGLTQGIIGDLFYVNVGSVVPHRDGEFGNKHPYIFTKIIKPWQTVTGIDSYRRYAGRLFQPPFIALRRTSAPKDYPRCVASIIALDEEVAVENHFLVLTPKYGKISTCELCLRSLSNTKTSSWINERIKCRHLTVSSIAELPLWAEEIK